MLNYTFDDRNGQEVLQRLFAEVAAPLVPGGLFLFDVAGPDRTPPEMTRTFCEQDDWLVLVETSGDRERLHRRINTFRKQGDLYRRSVESHELRLVAPERIEAELQRASLDSERISAYGEMRLPPGLYGFIARLPVKRVCDPKHNYQR